MLEHTVTTTDIDTFYKLSKKGLVCSYIPVKIDLPFYFIRSHEIKGYYYLYELLNLFGNTYFKYKWNSRHVFARELPPFENIFFEYGIIDTRKNIQLPPYITGTLKTGEQKNRINISNWQKIKPRYKVHTKDGFLSFNSHEQAKRIWEEEKTYLIRQYKHEYEASIKNQKIRTLIKELLQSKDLIAYIYDPKRPYLEKIDPDNWYQKPMISNILINYNIDNYFLPNFMEGLDINDYGYIVFEKKNVEKVLGSLEPEKSNHQTDNTNPHLNFYEQYHQEQIKRFLSGEITWPSSSQIIEEKALRAIMSNNGYNFQRTAFREARTKTLDYLKQKFPKNKKSKSDQKRLVEYYKNYP